MWFINQFGSLLNLATCKEYVSMAKAKTPRSTTPRSKSNGNAAVVEPVTEVQKAPLEVTLKASASKPRDLEAEIRARAYELYQERGATPGHQQEDWARAEREIMARQNHQQSA
jgi:Protein of unknown function (DUF2934)